MVQAATPAQPGPDSPKSSQQPDIAQPDPGHGVAGDGSRATRVSSSELIACPTCDALYRVREPEKGGKAVCKRCGTVLIAPRAGAGLRIIALTLTITILVTAAVFLPFLEIHAAGLGNSASLLDVALSFNSGALVVVSVSTVATIVLVPLMRTLLLLYVLVPVVADRPPARHARGAFRISQEMKPWAMTEIFALGCAVALVKVADLATLQFGPAFWMFALLVVIAVINDTYMCSWSIWKSLEARTDGADGAARADPVARAGGAGRPHAAAGPDGDGGKGTA